MGGLDGLKKALKGQNPQMTFITETPQTQDEWIDFSNREKITLLSNRAFDEKVVQTDAWTRQFYGKEIPFNPSYRGDSVWTGTLLAYTKPDISFAAATQDDVNAQSILEASKKRDGTYLTHVDRDSRTAYLMKIPEKHENLRNAALSVDHGFDAQRPNFELKELGRTVIRRYFENPESYRELDRDIPQPEDPHIRYIRYTLKEIRVTDESQIRATAFPKEDGWYFCDEKTGIPTGTPQDHNDPKTRYLKRKEHRIGLVARTGHYLRPEEMRVVYCDALTWDKKKALAEARPSKN
ncbi:hypothetical protein HY572_05745 [Candidatus Micrarchaeota archaeon]|nr:hypothetical protein [Candidatus Micrarchaeota archaeon]